MAAKKTPAKRPPGKGSPRGLKRVVADWDKVRIEFIHSGITAPELAIKYGVNKRTLQARQVREQWNIKREEASQKASAASAIMMAKKHATDMTSFNNTGLMLSKSFNALVGKRLAEALREKDPKPLCPAEIRALALAAESSQRMGRIAMGETSSNIGVGAIPAVGNADPGSEPVNTLALYAQMRGEILEEF